MSASRHACWAAVLLPVLGSCRTTPVPPPVPVVAAPPVWTPPEDPLAAPRAEVNRLSVEAQALVKAQAELTWKGWTLGEAVDLGGTYKGHEALFSAASVQKVEDLRAKASMAHSALALDEGRALRLFKLYLVGEIVSRESAALSDTAAGLAGGATFSSDGQTLAFRDLDLALQSELNTEKRRRFYKSALPIVRKMNAPLAEREKRLTAILAPLGYASTRDFVQELRGTTLEEGAALAEAVLAATEEPWRAAMGELARRELRLAMADLKRADVPRLFRIGPDSDAAFPKDRAVARLNETFAAIALDPAKLPNVKVDTEARPRRSPRALCVPVEVPGDVRLSLKPRGGVVDAAQQLHEMAHAIHFGVTHTEPWAFQQLGGNAAGETFAALMEGLVAEPRFSAAPSLTGEKLARHVRILVARQLFAVRTAAAHVIFDAARLGKEPPANLQASYAEIMGRAWGFTVDAEEAERFRVDVPELFAAVDELRAEVAAAQLGAWLGAPFWTDRTVGERLMPLLASGTRATYEEVVAVTGARGLDAKILGAEYAARLKPQAALPAAEAPKAAPGVEALKPGAEPAKAAPVEVPRAAAEPAKISRSATDAGILPDSGLSRGDAGTAP